MLGRARERAERATGATAGRLLRAGRLVPVGPGAATPGDTRHDDGPPPPCVYAPDRVRHPLACGVLVDMFRGARERLGDPVAAWATIGADPDSSRAYRAVRGRGGRVRIGWDEALDLVAAAQVHTALTHGADRIAGLSPEYGASVVSYTVGARFVALLGGVMLPPGRATNGDVGGGRSGAGERGGTGAGPWGAATCWLRHATDWLPGPPASPTAPPRVLTVWRADPFAPPPAPRPNGVGEDGGRPVRDLALLLSLDFRMTATALLADVVLPAATPYEKHDLDASGAPGRGHPARPGWQARTDGDVFHALARRIDDLARGRLDPRGAAGPRTGAGERGVLADRLRHFGPGAAGHGAAARALVAASASGGPGLDTDASVRDALLALCAEAEQQVRETDFEASPVRKADAGDLLVCGVGGRR